MLGDSPDTGAELVAALRHAAMAAKRLRTKTTVWILGRDPRATGGPIRDDEVEDIAPNLKEFIMFSSADDEIDEDEDD